MANLNIEQKKVKSLFQESKYNFLIPDYQRPYAWGEMECKTLWDDLFSFSFPNDDCDQFVDDEEYFLGPIVTFKNRNQMEVIDGQQRLTTLMLLLRAFYNKLGSMKDSRSKRMKEDIEKCIWRANEFGEFEMQQSGLSEVENPSEYMLNGRPENASGSVVVCLLEGTRPIMVEIQALVCDSNFGMARRTAAGTDYNRVNLLMAVLEKRAGIHMSGSDAYVNVAGGIKVSEPALDLGIVMALVSSFKNRAIDEKTVIFGEVGLAGEVRAVSQAQQRVNEAVKLGFKTCILPGVCLKNIKKNDKIEIIGVNNVQEAIKLI